MFSFEEQKRKFVSAHSTFHEWYTESRVSIIRFYCIKVIFWDRRYYFVTGQTPTPRYNAAFYHYRYIIIICEFQDHSLIRSPAAVNWTHFYGTKCNISREPTTSLFFTSCYILYYTVCTYFDILLPTFIDILFWKVVTKVQYYRSRSEGRRVIIRSVVW